MFGLGNELPKTLTKTEFDELFKQFKQGDKEARDKLINHNIRLVIGIVNTRFQTVNYDKEDLVSIGCIGLLKAIDTYDIEKNKFSTYASACIMNEILMFIRKLKKKTNNEISLNEPLANQKDGDELELIDTISSNIDVSEEVLDNETYKIIKHLVTTLPLREKEIIMMYFGFYDKRYNQLEISKKLGVSQAHISRLIKKTTEQIKDKLQEIGIIKYKNEGDMKMTKKLQTIYEYFYEYSKFEIDEMLNKLTDYEKELIKLRYGNDLLNPETSKNFTNEAKDKFYGTLIPKMKRLLKNPTIETTNQKQLNVNKLLPNDSFDEEIKSSTSTANTTKEVIETPVKIEENTKLLETNEISKEDYNQLLDLFKADFLKKLLSIYSPKEVFIISLKLGYIDNKCFSTNAIASFLEITNQEVIDITKKILLDYKQRILLMIDDVIKVATEEPIIDFNNQSNFSK